MLAIVISIALIISGVIGIALLYRSLTTLLLNIGCRLIFQSVPFDSMQSLAQGVLGLVLLFSAALLRLLLASG